MKNKIDKDHNPLTFYMLLTGEAKCCDGCGIRLQFSGVCPHCRASYFEGRAKELEDKVEDGTKEFAALKEEIKALREGLEALKEGD